MIRQLNPCDPETWFEDFKKSSHYRKAMSIYDHAILSHLEMTLLKAALHHTVYADGRKICEQYKIFDVIPHYYIKFLLDISPNSILDIGCGHNVFKKIYPNIIGMDANPDANYDMFDYFDEEFVVGHTNQYDAVITINAIHFSPIDSIRNRLLMIDRLLKPNGRAFVSTNLETWLMHTDKKIVQSMFGPFPRFEDIMKYIHQETLATGLNFLVIDYPILSYSKESTVRDDLNGNLRVVFEQC